MDEPWSAVTLRIRGSVDQIRDLPRELRQIGVTHETGRAHAIEILPDSDGCLQPRVEAIGQFLAQHRASLVSLPESTGRDIFVGWSPKQGMDSLVLDLGLLRSLVELHAELVFDVYTEEDDDIE